MIASPETSGPSESAANIELNDVEADTYEALKALYAEAHNKWLATLPRHTEKVPVDSDYL